MDNGNDNPEGDPNLEIFNFLFPQQTSAFVLIDGQNIASLTGNRKKPLDLDIFKNICRSNNGSHPNLEIRIKYYDWHILLHPDMDMIGDRNGNVHLVKEFFASLKKQKATIFGNNLERVRRREERERTNGNCKSTNMDFWIIQQMEACLADPFCSIIAVVSGDGDFAELLEKAKNLGKTAISISPEYSGSSLLEEACTTSIELRGLLGIDSSRSNS